MKRLAAVLLLTIYCIVNYGCVETDIDDVTEAIASSFTTEAETTEPAAETFFELEPKSPDEAEYYGDPVPKANENCDIPLEFVSFDMEKWIDVTYNHDALLSQGDDVYTILGKKCKRFKGEVYNNATEEGFMAEMYFDISDGALFFYIKSDYSIYSSEVEDIDNDGSLEVIMYTKSQDCMVDSITNTKYIMSIYLIDNNEGNVVFCDLYEPLCEYAIHDLTEHGMTEYTPYITSLFAYNDNSDSHIDFSYFIITRPDAGYTLIQNKAAYVGGGIDVSASRIDNYDMFAPYTSNSENWSVEVSYKEIYNEVISDEIAKRHKYYGICIVGENGKRYYYYMEPDYISSPIIFGQGHESSNRSLVVNEKIGYALLTYPAVTMTADEYNFDQIKIIDLKSGELIESAFSALEGLENVLPKDLIDHLKNDMDEFYVNPNYVNMYAEADENGFVLTVKAHIDGHDTFVTHGRLTYNPDSEQLFCVEYN